MVAEDSGALNLFVRRCDTSAGAIPGMQACILLRSAEAGAADSWLTTGDSDVLTGRGQAWYWDEIGTSYPCAFAAAWQRGRAVLLGDWYSDLGAGSVQRNNIGAWYLGGTSNRTMPAAGGALVPTRRVAWMRPQCAITYPDMQGWATAHAGAPAIGITNGRMTVTCGAGDAAAWQRTGALFTPAEGAIACLALTVSSGMCRLRIRSYDAAAPNRYTTELRITPTTVELWDVEVGARIGATWNRTASDRVRVLLDQAGTSVAGIVYEGNDTSEDRFWFPVASGAGIADGAAAGADFIQFTVDSNSSAAIDEWQAVWGSDCGDHIIGQTYSERYPIPVAASGVYLLQGAIVSAITGPAEIADAWTLPRTWQYPPGAMLPRVTASPRSGMRTRNFSEMSNATRSIRVAFKIGSTESFPFGRDVAAFIDRINAGGAQVDLRYGGGWHALGACGRLGMVAARAGMLRPKASMVSQRS